MRSRLASTRHSSPRPSGTPACGRTSVRDPHRHPPDVFFYNKALFEEAGLDPESPPTDQESFEAAITAISEQTDADGYQMVASGDGANFPVGIQFATLFYQGGGEWTNGDFTEATFNSDAGVQAASISPTW